MGIGGIGMSGIAEVLINLGYKITGSDVQSSISVNRLIDLGGSAVIGETIEWLGAEHLLENRAKSDKVKSKISKAVKERLTQSIELAVKIGAGLVVIDEIGSGLL